jgi:hypothetical protein
MLPRIISYGASADEAWNNAWEYIKELMVYKLEK